MSLKRQRKGVFGFFLSLMHEKTYTKSYELYNSSEDENIKSIKKSCLLITIQKNVLWIE